MLLRSIINGLDENPRPLVDKLVSTAMECLREPEGDALHNEVTRVAL